MSSDAAWVDDMPVAYDALLGPALFAPFADVLAERVAAQQPSAVVELAAGTGIATAALRRALPAASIAATDLNPSMVACGAERVPGVVWRQADAIDLPLPDGSVDAVVCQFGVMFFPDKPAAFAEMRRVLAPGGRVVLLIWDVVEASRFPAALVESLAAVFPEDPPAFVVKVPHGYADAGRVEADLATGGLRLDGLDRVVLQGSAPSAAGLARGFCLGTPLRFALERRGPLPELTDRVAAAMTDRLGQGSVEGELAALLVVATAG